MSNMNITLDDQALTSIIQKAILDTITPEKREALITSAIAQLLNGFGGRTSLLQQAFTNALERAVFELAKAEVERPEVKEKLKKLIHDALSCAFDEPLAYKRLTEKLAQGIHRGILEV